MGQIAGGSPMPAHNNTQSERFRWAGVCIAKAVKCSSGAGRFAEDRYVDPTRAAKRLLNVQARPGRTRPGRTPPDTPAPELILMTGRVSAGPHWIESSCERGRVGFS